MTTENVKTLEELVKENIKICDARKKAFVDLQEAIEGKLMKELRQIMVRYGIREVFICMDNKPYRNFKGYDAEYKKEYGICISVDASITEAQYNYIEERWVKTENESEGSIYKSASIEFADNILRRMENLNKEYAIINESAEKITNIINALW